MDKLFQESDQECPLGYLSLDECLDTVLEFRTLGGVRQGPQVFGVLSYTVEQEPHMGNKGNSVIWLALWVGDSCTSPEFTVSTGSAPGQNSRDVESRRPVACFGMSHPRKNKLLLKNPCPNLAETL